MDKSKLHELVRRKLYLDDNIASLEEDLASAKSERWRLVSHTLPALLTEQGLREATTDEGVQVVVADDVMGNIPKDEQRAREAMAWLRNNDHGDLIKNQVIASFTRGDDEIANTYARQLIEQGVTCEKRESVHPQTLLAWARKELKDGNIIDLEVMGLHQVTLAKVKATKES